MKEAHESTVGVIATVSDITARKAADDALRAAKQLTEQIIADAGEGIVVHDLELRYLEWNPFMERLRGVTKAAVLGKHPFEVFPFLRETDFPDLMERARAGATVTSRDFQFTTPAGITGWAVVRYQPLRNAGGEIIGVLGLLTDVTTRKLMEEELRESQRFSEQIIAGSREGIVVYDRELRFKVWNRAMEEWSGLSAASLLGKTPMQVFPDLSRPTYQEMLDRALRGENVGSSDFQFSAPSLDQSRWFTARYAPHWDGRGGVKGVIVAIHEITARKLAEERVRVSEERYRLLFDTIEEGVLLLDAAGRIMAFNPGAERILGVSGLAGRGVSLFDPSIRRIREDGTPLPPAEYPARITLRTGQPQSHVVMGVYRADGAVSWLSVSSRPVRHPGESEPHAVVLSFSDITERKRDEQARRASEARFRALVEHSWDGVLIHDAEWRIIYTSPGLTRVFGYSPAEYADTDSLARTHPDDVELLRGVRAELLRQPGVPLRVENRARRKDGAWRWIESLAVNKLAEPDVRGIVVNVRDITDRRQAEQALRDSEQRFRAIFDHALEGIFLLDGKGRITDVNPTGCTFLERQRAEIVGRRFLEFEAAERRGDLLRKWGELHATGQSAGTFTYGAASGKLVYFEYSLKADFLPDQYLLVARDVTVGVLAKEALRHSEERFSLAFDACPDPMTITSLPGGRYVNVNAAWTRALGFDERETVGLTPEALGVWIDEEQYRCFLAEVVGRRRVSDWEARLRARAGREDDYLVSAEILELHGRPHMIAVWKNITTRRQAEAALRESEERFSKAFNFSPLPMALATYPDGKLVGASDRMKAFAGYPADELLGHSLAELEAWVRPEDRDTFYRLLAKRGQVRDWEVQLKNSAGDLLTVLLSVEIVKMNGRPHLLAAANDITERKRAEANLAESREQLRALSARLATIREAERTAISREIHDELGQLLTGLKLDTSWFRKRLAAAAEIPAQAAMLDKLATISDLLDTTIQTVREMATRLRPGVLDNAGLTAAVEWQMQEFETRTGIAYALTLCPEPPGLHAECSTALFRILQEILTNVIRHADARQVTVRLFSEGNDLLLVVADDGRGITTEQLNDRKSIGLLGMQERALMVGGAVTLSGEPGGGTTVTVRVPYDPRTNQTFRRD